MDVRSATDEFEVPWSSFAEFFAARRDHDSPFLTELDHASGTRRQWTVGEWRDRVLATASWLGSHGVKENGAVATLAGNSADALSVAYAAWVIGACCVPLNPGDSAERQAYILRDSGARLLIHNRDEDLFHLVGDTGRIELKSTSELPIGDGPEVTVSTAGVGSIDLPALRVYTSGTTGRPKGVVLSARNLLTDCDGLRLALAWPADTRILTVLPVHHVNGLVISSLLPWYAGYSTVLCDRFRSDRFWADAERDGATVCSVVPSLLEFLLRSDGSAPSSFREFLCGAGPLLTDTVVEFEERFGVPVRHLYGLSETTAVVTLTPRSDARERRRWHTAHGAPSIGPAIPHAQVAVHTSAGEIAAAGERGELVVRGGVVMQGYADLPDATAEALRDGWFHTGDEGFWHESPGGEPFFFITGRLKELIIRGGANISPLEVDAVLRSHPAVEFGLAVPFENRFYGEEVAAYVVTSSPVTDDEILAHCARHLDHARRPKVVIQGDDIPYTATGKAKRLELKKRLAPVLRQYRDHQFRRSSGASASELPAE